MKIGRPKTPRMALCAAWGVTWGLLWSSPYSCFLSHTSQVIQQALHRQPSTAAQYLQQMYAAQQQHLMLQTAALQQQHLSSAQLQSLAAVQQVRDEGRANPGSIGTCVVIRE